MASWFFASAFSEYFFWFRLKPHTNIILYNFPIGSEFQFSVRNFLPSRAFTLIYCDCVWYSRWYSLFLSTTNYYCTAIIPGEWCHMLNPHWNDTCSNIVSSVLDRFFQFLFHVIILEIKFILLCVFICKLIFSSLFQC